MTRPVEVSWFAALCDDDYEFLGVPDAALRSSYEHCRSIVLEAEKGGFDNILLPSGYALGIDSVAFAGGVAPLLERLHLLLAVRCAEMWPPMLARQLATLDQMPSWPADDQHHLLRSRRRPDRVRAALRALDRGDGAAPHAALR